MVTQAGLGRVLILTMIATVPDEIPAIGFHEGHHLPGPSSGLIRLPAPANSRMVPFCYRPLPLSVGTSLVI